MKILNDRSLDSVALDAHFSADDAKLAGEALKALFNRDGLEPGYVVAMRGFRPTRETTTMSLMQVSIYAKNVFVGTLTRNAAGAFVSGVDPWVREDLFNYSGARGGRHAQEAIPPARRDLFDGRPQQCSDRRDRRSDHVSVERTGSGCLRQRGPAPGADLFADAARQGRDVPDGCCMSASRAAKKASTVSSSSRATASSPASPATIRFAR